MQKTLWAATGAGDLTLRSLNRIQSPHVFKRERMEVDQGADDRQTLALAQTQGLQIRKQRLRSVKVLY